MSQIPKEMKEALKEFKATKQALELIGLADEEADIYFKITGRGPVSAGEIAILLRKSEDEEVPPERGLEVAQKLLNKGLVREIPGKTPHYMALPPYVALLNQIRSFKETIQNIQRITPQRVEERFKNIEKQSAKLQKFEEYRNFILRMKEELPLQIKRSFDKFDKELEQIKKFHQIKSYIITTRENVPQDIERQFNKMNEKVEIIKSEISEAFEKQFRIGALKSMAERIVGRIMEAQLGEMMNTFRQRFISTTQNMLDGVLQQLGMISDTAGEISSGLGSAYDDIEEGLKSTLSNLEARIGEVHQEIISGINDLKNMFRQEVFETLQKDIISEIIKQLDLSEATMTEFWERSKKASMLSFKDVWFIRSAEAMKAQINESISRVKMRLFIIAPTLSDIDLVALKNIKKHVNIRISTHYDTNTPSDKKRMDYLAQFPNINIRYYERKNLWAINKDFEEIVLCVVSGTDMEHREIAGMGSILEEHIKLFAAVIEDIWIQSKKQKSLGFGL